MSDRIIKDIKLSDCIKCGSNDWHLIFPDNHVTARCVKCNFQRKLTHTEVNAYCWMWG